MQTRTTIRMAVLLGLGLCFVLGSRPKGPSPKALDWGVYQIYWRPERFEQNLDRQLGQLGGRCGYALFFRDLSARRGFPRAPIEICRARGLTPVVSLELWEWSRHPGRQPGGLEAIVAGQHDAFFSAWAADAAAYGHPLILRFGFEMNGDWFAWGNQPDRFKQAWRRVHRIFRDRKATNVQWMFSPNILSPDKNPDEHLLPYYPGHDVVDLIGLDGYNFGDGHDQWHTWTPYRDVFERTIRAAQAWPKPLMISEVGCADDPRKPVWLQDFLATVSADRRVSGFIYFNHDKRREGEPNWRIDSDPESLSVFQAWAARQAERAAP
jgi:hypothetical protein